MLSSQQFKIPFNAFCSLVLVCKDIISNYGKNRSKCFLSTVGTFYKQTDGVAMGSSLEPFIVNSFLSNCLSNCLQGFKSVFLAT